MPPYRAQSAGLFGSSVYPSLRRPTIDFGQVVDALAGGANSVLNTIVAKKQREQQLADDAVRREHEQTQFTQAQQDRQRAIRLQDEDRAIAAQERDRAHANQEREFAMKDAELRASGITHTPASVNPIAAAYGAGMAASPVAAPVQAASPVTPDSYNYDPTKTAAYEAQQITRARKRAEYLRAGVRPELVDALVDNPTLADHVAPFYHPPVSAQDTEGARILAEQREQGMISSAANRFVNSAIAQLPANATAAQVVQKALAAAQSDPGAKKLLATGRLTADHLWGAYQARADKKRTNSTDAIIGALGLDDGSGTTPPAGPAAPTRAPLTAADSVRAKSDPAFRSWLMTTKGYTPAELP